MMYKTVNGTGTGEIMLSIQTVDKVPLSAAFLNEAKKPGSYSERFSIDTTADPDCDPTTRKKFNFYFNFNIKIFVNR